jgi:anti-anti-sigma regulatory factor
MVLEADLSIKTVKTFYESLQKEFQENDRVNLDFSRVHRIDLSIIQVIIAAGREARDRGKVLRMKSVPEEIRNQMHICGLKV